MNQKSSLREDPQFVSGVLTGNNPPVHVIDAAVKLATDAKVDGVVSVGGGSSMDVAKLVALLAV
ncbi:iron-containing alcohol dehydrogenase, partial [Sandarakinorhabdus oryzae]|uniref:iron-containing alcohol dehydrogenase n=1 Tax=Sandarakinorhabdus oryzae TaxID=2675220 RepID=UPI0018CC3728